MLIAGIIVTVFGLGVIAGLTWHDPLLRALARRRGEVYVVTLRSAKSAPRRPRAVKTPDVVEPTSSL